MRQLFIALVLSASALGPSLAKAQDRAPVARGSLVDLAYVLGQAHGLAQVCDPAVQLWRTRMLRLVELEAPDDDFRRQLFAGFNTGFSAAQARHPACGAASRRAFAAAAAEGRGLARAIASAP